MQRILVPTDFSPIAENALQYAVEIATKLQSDILLYHVYHFRRKVDYNWDFPEHEQPFIKQIEKQMMFAAWKVEQLVKRRGLKLSTEIAEDNILSLFKRKVDRHDVDLIVMGSKGATGLKKVIFGSVAATALEMAEVPILVVPPDQSFVPPQKIVLAVDANEVRTDVLAPLRELALKFDAQITILTVQTDSNQNAFHLENVALEGVPVTYREIPMVNSVNESISDFVAEGQFDLLCMIRRDKGFFQGLFETSVTTIQVYTSDIPLLVLPER